MRSWVYLVQARCFSADTSYKQIFTYDCACTQSETLLLLRLRHVRLCVHEEYAE